MTAALAGVALVIPVEDSMKTPKDFPKVMTIALGTVTGVLMIVGMTGFAASGANTRSIILLNMGKRFIVSLFKLVLVIGILFTYPLQLVPVIHAFGRFLFGERHSRREGTRSEGYATNGDIELEGREDEDSPPAPTDKNDDDLQGDDQSDVESQEMTQLSSASSTSELSPRRKYVRDPKRILARLSIVFATGATAVLAGASFGLFQSLVGSLGASSYLAYTAPAILHLQTFGAEMNGSSRLKDWCIIFGLLGSFVGRAATIWEISRVHSGEITPQ